MQDAITYVRSIVGQADEATMRFGSAARRWQEESDAARRIWDDAAGRAVFQSLLDPYRVELDVAAPALAAVAQGQRDVVERVAAAHAATAAAHEAIRDAQAAAERARRQSGVARAQAGSARGEAAGARRLAGDVAMQLNSLGGG